jgi:glycosyltransferase involved in cell wall biosynthesis
MKKIGILVVAYNAASTLAQVLDRIPREFVPRVSEVLVCDDHSEDSTYLIGLGYQQAYNDLPVKVVRHPRNLGYGGNQKAGYRWAIESGLDVVVMLHGDGQYAPEALPQIVEPLELDKCDAVFGSRMLVRGAARLGGMPLYKYVGNHILTGFQNAVTGMDLSEWHSGYRAYNVAALSEIPFDGNSDDFDFDTQIILQLHEAGKRIEEVPIPTFYGDEISRVNGLRYARDVTIHAARYRAHKMGLGTGEMAFASRAYERKLDPETSHGRILSWLADRRPGRVLDLGCSDGALGAELRTHGHRVTGVDIEEHPGVRERVDEFIAADLDAGLPDAVGDGFDVIVAADVLEHVREPDRLLASLAGRLAPGGSILTCVPNFGHWYPRLRVALGRFDYDRRGILDRDHVRFFTRKSLERTIDRAGYSVRRREFLTLPVEVVQRGGQDDRAGAGEKALRAFKRVDRIGTALRPTLFAYQFLYELEPTR